MHQPAETGVGMTSFTGRAEINGKKVKFSVEIKKKIFLLCLLSNKATLRTSGLACSSLTFYTDLTSSVTWKTQACGYWSWTLLECLPNPANRAQSI